MVDIPKGTSEEREEQPEKVLVLRSPYYGVVGTLGRHVHDDYYIVEVEGKEITLEYGQRRKEFQILEEV